MSHTIVMTGATRGIGRVAVEHILADEPDAHLVLLGRAPAVTELAAKLAVPGRRVSAITTDLGAMDSVRTAVTRLRTSVECGELPPLRTLVCNAGLQFANNTTEGPDGFEVTFAVNVLSNHLLIRGLQQHFASPGRVVITVSDTHFGDVKHNMGMVPGPRWQTPDALARIRAFDRPDTMAAGRAAYSTSKLAAIYLVHEYARRLPAGVDVVSFNPGLVPGTGLARDAGPIGRFAMRRIMPAMTLTPMATSQKAAGRHLADVATGATAARTGMYVDRDRTVESSPESYDRARETQL